MYNLVFAQLESGFAVLTTAYWICMIVGGGLLLISTFLGGDGHGIDADGIDADFDADFSVDADVPVDASLDADVDVSADPDLSADGGTDAAGEVHVEHAAASSLSTWFSIRFAIFFMAVFGLIGVVLTHMSDLSGGIVAGSALIGGVVFGQGVHQMFRKLRRSSGNSTVEPRDYIDKLARVTVAIRSGRKGEVAVRVLRGERFVPAVARREGGTFDAGEIVAVVGYTAGLVEVVSRKEFEFLGNAEEGEES